MRHPRVPPLSRAQDTAPCIYAEQFISLGHLIDSGPDEAGHLVHGADHTGIEGADDVRNRDRLALPRLHRCPDERLFQRTGHALAIARREVPGSRGDDLVVRDAAVVYLEPMTETTARGLDQPGGA